MTKVVEMQMGDPDCFYRDSPAMVPVVSPRRPATLASKHKGVRTRRVWLSVDADLRVYARDPVGRNSGRG